MSATDAVSAFFIIVGFLAVLLGFVLVLNAIIKDALHGWQTEQNLRASGRRVDHLNGAPEFFRPRYARNRR